MGGNGTGLELVVGIKHGALRAHGLQWTAGGFLPDPLLAWFHLFNRQFVHDSSPREPHNGPKLYVLQTLQAYCSRTKYSTCGGQIL